MILRTATIVAAICAVVALPDQVVLGPSPVPVRPQGSLPTIADLLTLEPKASIFYSYAREVDISSLFTQTGGEGVVVFVPTNKAVQALSRKPHQDPHTNGVVMSEAEYDSISKSNVRRWVGAHIIPNHFVDFSNPEPFDTLTPGTTITFTHINTQGNSAAQFRQFHQDTDADHFAEVKGSRPIVDTDAAHFASVKGPAKPAADPKFHTVDSDADHFPEVKGPSSPRMNLRFGLAAAGRINNDAAHFSTIKSSISRDAAPQAKCAHHAQERWKQYVINRDVRIIGRKKASNGIIYLIDGTVAV